MTTKLPGRHHGFESALASFEESRANLGLDYVDLYLIHWPLPRVDKYVDTWRAMIQLREQGLARSIGVSNFTPAYLTRLVEETGVAPAVNQIELHPRFPQAALREFNLSLGIVTESWSPLARQNPVADEPAVVPPQKPTASRPPRSCCAGTSSSARCRCRNPRMRRGRPRTSTCSASR